MIKKKVLYTRVFSRITLEKKKKLFSFSFFFFFMYFCFCGFTGTKVAKNVDLFLHVCTLPAALRKIQVQWEIRKQAPEHYCFYLMYAFSPLHATKSCTLCLEMRDCNMGFCSHPPPIVGLNVRWKWQEASKELGDVSVPGVRGLYFYEPPSSNIYYWRRWFAGAKPSHSLNDFSAPS